MVSWQDAHVGAESSITGFRTTEEEKERLEELRRELRLTSKGQVIRAALDLLERSAVAMDTLTLQPAAEKKETRRVMRRARRAYGVPRRSDIEAAPADDAVAVNRNLRTSFRHVVAGGDGDGSPGAGGGCGQEEGQAA